MSKRQRRNSKSQCARFVALDDTALQNVGGGIDTDDLARKLIDRFNNLVDVVIRRIESP